VIEVWVAWVLGMGGGYKKPENGGKNGSENCVFGGAR